MARNNFENQVLPKNLSIGPKGIEESWRLCELTLIQAFPNWYWREAAG